MTCWPKYSADFHSFDSHDVFEQALGRTMFPYAVFGMKLGAGLENDEYEDNQATINRAGSF
jgi:hypothetical protein